jgi:hypothetical protein
MRRWREDCELNSVTIETAVGRWLACSAHPEAAWRVLRLRGRALLVGTYFGAAYVAALMVLLTIG